MKRNKKENLFSVEFGMKHLPVYVKDSFNNMFFHKFLVQNDFIDFVYGKIKDKCKDDEEFNNAITLLETEGKKNDNIAINKSERSDELKQAYEIIRAKFKQYNILDRNILSKEYRKIYDTKHKLYLPDNMFSYALDDKIDAFSKVYIVGDGYKVTKRRLVDTNTLRSKPELTNENCDIKLVQEGDRYYIVLRNCTTSYMHSLLSKYYDTKTKQYKPIIDKNGNVHPRQRISKYETIKVRIYYNPNNKLQKFLLEHPENRGSIILVRHLKKGKYRYGIQIAFEGISPVFDDRKRGINEVGVNVGTEIVAVSTKLGDKQCIYNLHKNDNKICEKLIELKQYMDRSLRATNPNCYRENGIPYSKVELEQLGLSLVKSKRYMIASKQQRELYRKLKTSRKTNNYTLAKRIQMDFDIGTLYIDRNQIKGWSVRKCRASEKSKARLDKTDRNPKGYPRQVQERAPAQFTERLKYNVEKLGGKVVTMATFNSTMFNPFTNQNDIFTKLCHRFTRMDVNTEYYLYNEQAIDLLKTIIPIVDKDNNVYYVQRDLFASFKMCYIHKGIETYVDKNGEPKEREIDIFDEDEFMENFKNVFYPKHIEYLTTLLNEYYSGNELSGTIFGK